MTDPFLHPKQQRAFESFQPVAEEYAGFVYSAALRALGKPEDAEEAARAVFQNLAKRRPRLPDKTPICSWLFRATMLAARKLERSRKRLAAGPPPDPEAARWKLLLRLLSRMRPRHLDVILLQFVLGQSPEITALVLRTKERKVMKRTQKGLALLQRKLRKSADWAGQNPAEMLGSLIALPLVPEGLAERMTEAGREAIARQPAPPLARALARSLAWVRWKRRFRLALHAAWIFAALIGVTALIVASLWQSGHLLAWLMIFGTRNQVKEFPELAIPPQPWPAGGEQLAVKAAASTADLFKTTNIWIADFQFAKEQWDDLEPEKRKRVRLMNPDGTIQLVNTNSARNGLAGVLGFEFDWVEGNLKIAGHSFQKIAVRCRGNGTYLDSLYGIKRSLKADLNKLTKGQKLGEADTLNFNNLITDSSFMHDALGYEFFREAGVPAPRTAYAWITATVPPEWDRKPFGLFLLLENVDDDFAKFQFGTKKTPIFKPVTYDLFLDLGKDWSAYERLYDLKTEATDEQKQRVIDLARLLTHASDEEFARRSEEFVDFEAFAGFLGGMVLLSSYDGFLSTGQNFYMYLDPRSNKFGFIPWDLDHAWGEFSFVGTDEVREQASIWKPAAVRHRFLSRMMAVEPFRAVYRQKLEKMLELFTPERLGGKIDALAEVLRGPVGAESAFRLRRFEQAVSDEWQPRGQPNEMGLKRPPHQLKRFILNRAKSVREQLDGKSEGKLLTLGETSQ